jgi:hypothetical protein
LLLRYFPIPGGALPGFTGAKFVSRFAFDAGPTATIDIWGLELLWRLALGIWRFTPAYSLRNQPFYPAFAA